MKNIGSRYFASSFITLKSGETLYLSNHIDDLEDKMRSKKKVIEVTTSNLFSRSYYISKNSIELYGKM